jgi:molybdopterin/thiamine biosynthesis adenylyltransferase
MLTSKERERYDRQILIEEIGETGQEKLKGARVLIAGSGGLGSPISIYLAAAGVGRIRIVDHEEVDLSNLNRQILHWEKDIGRKKVDSAREKLLGLNPHVTIEAVRETITEDNVSRLVAGFDLIVDAMDNFPTRYLLNRSAIENDIPFFHGAVNGFEGRAMTILPGKSACLRCMYRGPIPKEKFPVIGVAPAVIGSIQATEVIKYIVGVGKLLTNRLLVYDGLNLTFTEFKVAKNPNCEHCGDLTTKELA